MIHRPRLKIAFIDCTLEPDKPGCSGLSDIVWEMAAVLADMKHDVHVVASYHTDHYPDPRVRVHNFPTPPMGYRNVVGQIWLLKRAAGIVKRLQPDIVHAPEYNSTAVLATLGVKTPLVLTVPGNIFHRVKHGHGYHRIYVPFLKWAARVSARRCARVIAISEEMRRWWIWTGSDPENTVFIPLGVDESRFHPVVDARARLGLPEQNLVLLFAGRFSPEKGIIDLLGALARIRRQLEESGAQILLVGKGWLEREIRRIVSKEDLSRIVQIRSWIPRDDMNIWFSAADALLLPSHSEGFSRTIPEAMMCGTPVIGSRITGTEDHVLEGVNGHLFPAKDDEALAGLLFQIVSNADRLRAQRSATLAYAREHFSWPHIVGQVVRQVYHPIVSRGSYMPVRDREVDSVPN